MTRLVLVRHGETEWNRRGMIQGQSDVPLNETGREQARQLALRLEGMGLVAIYASDLARAAQTARVTGELTGLPVVPVSCFREMCYGRWEGLSWSEVAARFPECLCRWREDSVTTAPPGGESFARVMDRVWTGLGGVMDRHRGETLAVVTHSGPIKAVLCGTLGLDPSCRWRAEVKNASVNILELRRDGWRLVLWNDRCHL